MKKISKIILSFAIIVCCLFSTFVNASAFSGTFDNWSYSSCYGYIPMNVAYLTENNTKSVYIDVVNGSLSYGDSGGEHFIPSTNNTLLVGDKIDNPSTVPTYSAYEDNPIMYSTGNTVSMPWFYTERNREFVLPLYYTTTEGAITDYSSYYRYDTVSVNYYLLLPFGVDIEDVYNIHIVFDGISKLADYDDDSPYLHDTLIGLDSEYITITDIGQSNINNSYYPNSVTINPSGYVGNYLNIYKVTFDYLDYIADNAWSYSWYSGFIGVGGYNVINHNVVFSNLDIMLETVSSGADFYNTMYDDVNAYYNHFYADEWNEDIPIMKSVNWLSQMIFRNGLPIALSFGCGIDRNDFYVDDFATISKTRYLESLGKAVIINTQEVGLENFNLFSWLGNTLGGLLDVNIIGSQSFGISIGDILSVTIFIGLFMWFLKVFAGG